MRLLVTLKPKRGRLSPKEQTRRSVTHHDRQFVWKVSLHGWDNGDWVTKQLEKPYPNRYDRSRDPDEHIDAYVAQLTLYTIDAHIYCKVFPTSLKALALNWFTWLPPYTIDSLKTLKAKFAAQFTTSKPHHMTSVALVNIRQEKEESLRTFMDRIDKVALCIRRLISEVAMHHLITALRPRPFADSLCM